MAKRFGSNMTLLNREGRTLPRPDGRYWQRWVRWPIPAPVTRFLALREYAVASQVTSGKGRVAAFCRSIARIRSELGFWSGLLALMPTIALGLLRHDPDLAQRIKARLAPAPQMVVLDPKVLVADSVTPKKPGPLPPVQIIMPIHNAFDLLEEALGRVVAHTDLPWRLILVEDRSSDPRVRPWLRAWVRAQARGHPGRILLLENPKNLGFVGAVNRGFGHVDPAAGPVVLLNSDAMVPTDWASRLTAPLRDPEVATATPFTNDGEIFSVPIIAEREDLAPGQGDRIDTALRERIVPLGVEVSVPTGVGFCMAIGADWLKRIGGFDPAFGRGYGEETDWCQRAAALGGRHMAVPNLFVEHRGGASFGAEKRVRLRESGAIISDRYPGYDRAVRRFIRTDPLATPRLVAALAWAESGGELEGTSPHSEARSDCNAATSHLDGKYARGVSLDLRLKKGHRHVLRFTTPRGRVTATADNVEVIKKLLGPLTRIRFTECRETNPSICRGRDQPQGRATHAQSVKSLPKHTGLADVAQQCVLLRREVGSGSP